MISFFKKKYGIVQENDLFDSLNTEHFYKNCQIVTHIKGRLLDQAVIIFNCIPFQNENFS